MRLDGKGAIVTGSSTGIGRGIALTLAHYGASVVVNARGSGASGVKAIDDVVDEITSAGGKAIAVAGSVDDPNFANRLVERCIDAFGAVDILVNNAAIYDAQCILPVTECPLDTWQRILSVDVNSVFFMSRAALPHMIKKRWGRVITAASYAGTGRLGGSAYCTAKSALFGLTRAMAVDYGPYGITSNAYNPEALTPNSQSVDPEGMAAMVNRWVTRGALTARELNYMVELGGPDGVAPWIAYLCLDESANINGHTFAVEGRRVSLIAPPDEARLLYRNATDQGPWSLDELVKLSPMAFPLTNEWPRRSEEELAAWGG